MFCRRSSRLVSSAAGYQAEPLGHHIVRELRQRQRVEVVQLSLQRAVPGPILFLVPNSGDIVFSYT